MSENEVKPIKRQIKISKYRLWIIWFLLIVLPIITGLILYNAFQKEYFYFSKTDEIYKGYESIENYKQMMAPENYMTKQLPNISSLDASQDQEKIKEQIDNELCGETSFCMFFDRNVKIKTIKGHNFSEKNFRIPPTPLIKKYIQNLISVYSVDNSVDQSKQLEKCYHDFGPILQQLYKTPTSISLKKDKISKNFSIKYGGELYFIFTIFNNPQKDTYGFLAIMQGKNFSFKEMLDKLHKDYPYVRIVFKEIDIQKSYLQPEVFYSGLQQTPTCMKILSPASMSFSRHVLHGGTEKFNLKFDKLLPFIEYQIPLNKISNELTQIHNHLYILALLLIIASGTYCLHIHLFGFSEKLSFKKKILLLTLITSIFPFSLFCLTVYTVKTYSDFINELSVKHHAETILQMTNLQFEQFISKVETNSAKIAEGLTAIFNEENLTLERLKDYLIKSGQKIPASQFTILFKTIPDALKNDINDEKFTLDFPDRLSTEATDDSSAATMNILPKFALETIDDYKNFVQDRRRKNEVLIFNKPVKADQLVKFQENEGKINLISNSNIPIWLSSLMITNTLTQPNEVVALLVSKYEPKPLISEYLKISEINKKAYKETFRNFEINYAYLPVTKSGNANCWQGSGNIDQEDRKKILERLTNESFYINKNSDYKYVIKRYNQLAPHIGIAIITNNNNGSQIFSIPIIIGLILIFLFLLLYLTSKLFDLMFIEPVNALTSSTISIAEGSENWEANIKSGDEFEDLNNDFKQLVVGLKERNILKNYVSEDAFSDIENSSLKLQPGGEYKDVTIIFSAIKNYEKLIKDLSPQEVIKLLSQYISIADEVTQKYNGNLDKILGDTVMLVFRDDQNNISHGLRAAEAALEFVEKIKSAGFPGLYTGIASGKVISGKIGSYSGKLDFTVIGNPVNLAARFKAESKKGTENTGIIISGITIGLMQGKGQVKFLRRVAIKGKARKYNIYELISVRD